MVPIIGNIAKQIGAYHLFYRLPDRKRIQQYNVSTCTCGAFFRSDHFCANLPHIVAFFKKLKPAITVSRLILEITQIMTNRMRSKIAIICIVFFRKTERNLYQSGKFDQILLGTFLGMVTINCYCVIEDIQTC
jgi:hypothetical protein